MFGWVRDFYKRHRKKIIFTGVLAGGTYILSKYISWKLEDWQETKLREYTQETKKLYHYESNQRTCTMTFVSFLPNIQNTIGQEINTEEVLELLKLKPMNKLEMWERLKILSMCQFLCSVVANVTLLVFLKVELNIVGAVMFKTYLKGDTQEPNEEMSDMQVKYLNNVSYLIEKQLIQLCADTMLAVQDVLSSVSLKEKISFKGLQLIIENAKKKLYISLLQQDAQERHAFCVYMVDPEWTSISSSSDTYSKMMTRTVNVLQSKQCKQVINDCVNAAIDQALDSMKGSFYGSQEDPEAIVSLENCIKTDFHKPIGLPLAKIIPLLNAQFHEIFRAGSNPFLDSLFSLDSLREFSSNIYDSFSMDSEI